MTHLEGEDSGDDDGDDDGRLDGTLLGNDDTLGDDDGSSLGINSSHMSSVSICNLGLPLTPQSQSRDRALCAAITSMTPCPKPPLFPDTVQSSQQLPVEEAQSVAGLKSGAPQVDKSSPEEHVAP